MKRQRQCRNLLTRSLRKLKLKKVGHPIPENDIWVAATCLEVGVPLLTRDGHFDYIHGLEVINWEEQQEKINR